MEHQGSDLMWGGWGELMAQEICSSCRQLINTYLSICCMSDLGVIVEIQHVGKLSTWIYPSSLECLLSATMSSINTSTEHDDGISVLFSNFYTLWSFGSLIGRV
ncbi:hypothetical protein F2Q68_00004040 [Brassica cretica]|uniref:Uncharacterized protein n=1 Tax=Brassica cretica TaxID=69181 RepID=A0A8S9JC11_BRACR|nr:hypothetical protein F2Q68_00004040 [Brassica cretica]